jgi:hypothetical protein
MGGQRQPKARVAKAATVKIIKKVGNWQKKEKKEMKNKKG